ncbi:hypothetical protein PR048_030392 [Dryococelus australis]|uniref:Tudor domain-containing protein n=1 Tax=Dryococelus australis TaxID=614101 RepID=A0ABQ9G8V8_9NEOP|nr:hypothetical protein PR048_030392 [Dryococelus australis]
MYQHVLPTPGHCYKVNRPCNDVTGGGRLAATHQSNLVATNQQLPNPEDLGPSDRCELPRCRGSRHSPSYMHTAMESPPRNFLPLIQLPPYLHQPDQLHCTAITDVGCCPGALPPCEPVYNEVQCPPKRHIKDAAFSYEVVSREGSQATCILTIVYSEEMHRVLMHPWQPLPEDAGLKTVSFDDGTPVVISSFFNHEHVYLRPATKQHMLHHHLVLSATAAYADLDAELWKSALNSGSWVLFIPKTQGQCRGCGVGEVENLQGSCGNGRKRPKTGLCSPGPADGGVSVRRGVKHIADLQAAASGPQAIPAITAVKEAHKSTITAKEHAAEFSKHALNARDDKIIFCKFCTASVNWDHRDSDSGLLATSLLAITVNSSCWYVSGRELGHKGPRVGEMVACQFSGDGIFYRAQVVAADGNSYTVAYVDFGNQEAVSLDKMRALNSPLKQHPCYAVRTSLKDIPMMSLTSAAAKYLMKLVKEETILQLELQGSISEGVKLYCDKKCVNEYVKELLQEQWRKDLASDVPPARCSGATLKYVTLPLTRTVPLVILSVLGEGEDGDLTVSGCRADEEVIHYVYRTLLREINLYAYHSKAKMFVPHVGDACIAKNSELRRNEVVVMLVDVGTIIVIPYYHVRSIVAEFTEAPALALLCRFKG